MKHYFSLSMIEEIFKESGANRVSDKAKVEFRNILENKAKEIAKKSIKYSNHFKRNTIMYDDVELSLDNL